LIQERSAEVNRLQKTLEGANIKIASVATNIMGVSGREILAAMVEGRVDVVAMAQLAKGKLRKKLPELEQALEGRMGAHQRFLISHQLNHIDFLGETITQVSAEIQERLRPLEEAIERLDQIPGIGRRTAEALLAEIGHDMDRFPTAAHLASWAGMCPGNNESAGKRKSSRTRKGSPWLRSLLVEAAQAAARTKHTYLAAQYHRLVTRRGKKKQLLPSVTPSS
jgi:transposase